MTRMNMYEIDLKSDDGYKTTLILNATDEERARYIVMQAERCPERSILAVRKVGCQQCSALARTHHLYQHWYTKQEATK